MPKQPNIVLIIADQWATQIADGSGHNAGGVETPNIDQLAAEGMRFTQSYASFPLCCPVRSTMFTGLMPHHHRIIDNEEIYKDKYGQFPTRTDIPTMGSVFKAAGYKTAYFGKEHAADYGWDGIDEFGTMKYSAGGMLAEGSVYDQVFTRDAINFLKRDHDDPFYMVLSLINPHDICKVLEVGKVQGATMADAIFFCRTDDEPYLRFQSRPELPDSHAIPALKSMHPHTDYMYKELDEWDEDWWKRYLATYCLLMEKTDWYIGAVLDQLKLAGLDEETIVIFTTDHGEMVGSHRLISKNIFYEESAKTMMIVKRPGETEAGSVNETALINTTDLMPTMIDLCGVTVPSGLDGQSFAPLCRGEEQTGFDELFAVNASGRMLRFGSYKYVRSDIYGVQHEVLFDLDADPNESTNLFQSEGYEAVSEEASARMTAWLEQEGLKTTFDPI